MYYLRSTLNFEIDIHFETKSTFETGIQFEVDYF